MMNRNKSYFWQFVIAVSYTCLIGSSDIDTKAFIYNKLLPIKKYDMFLEGLIKDKTVYDAIFPMIQQNNADIDIFHELLHTSKFFTYKNKSYSLQNHKDRLIGKSIGFVGAAKNEYTMLNILLQGIVMMPNPKQTKETSAEESWIPTGPSKLIISDQTVLWAQQEFIIELDFYISEFGKECNLDQKPTWQKFTTWITDLDAWWIQQEFDAWITKTFNMLAKKHTAIPKTIFTRNNIIFFIEKYLPKAFIMQNSKRAQISFEELKEIFPGFKIYETSKVYNLKHDPITQREIAFLIKAINANIQQLLNKDKQKNALQLN